MRTEAIAAEQTSRNRYWRPSPLPPREVELSVRLQIPGDDDASITIRLDFLPRLPERWEDDLEQQLFDGVHGGLASVSAPLPKDGISIQITELRITPALECDSDSTEILRIGDVLETLTAATVFGLWSGLICLGSASAA